MHPPSEPTQTRTPQTYRVSVESHLSPDWLAMPGVVTLTTEYDSAGSPMTTLLLEVIDRAQMLGVLYEMHDLNLSLLSLELVRHPHPTQMAARPPRRAPENGIGGSYA